MNDVWSTQLFLFLSSSQLVVDLHQLMMRFSRGRGTGGHLAVAWSFVADLLTTAKWPPSGERSAEPIELPPFDLYI